MTRLLRDPSLVRTMAAVLIGSSALSLLEPVIPLHLEHRFGAGAAATGLLFGVATLAHAAVSPAVGALADRIDGTWLMSGGLIALGALFPVLVVARSVLALGLALAAVAVAYSFVVVAALPHIARTAAGAAQSSATVFGLFNLGYGAGMVLGPLSASLAMGISSIPITLIGSGAVVCVAGLGLARSTEKRPLTIAAHLTKENHHVP
jgi:MFS family permease